MSLNNLPSSIQDMIQTGFLDRRIQDSLRAKLGYRLLADREPFLAAVGETVKKTRVGLLPAITEPVAAAANSDIQSGMSAQNYNIEQYDLSVAQISGMMDLNIVTSRVAIGNQFLINAGRLAEQAARSVDLRARDAVFTKYMGGNTAVTTTLGAAGTTIEVDDIRGFFEVMTSMGTMAPISTTYNLAVQIGSDTYELVAAVADGAAPTNPVPNMVYSGTGSNTSKAPGGISGTLTFSSNVTVADGTAGQAVVASNAPLITRPDGSLSTGAMAKGTILTIDAILQAKATLEANSVPTGDDGRYIAYVDPLQLIGLYKDPAFLSFARGNLDSDEYKMGAIADLMGVKVIKTTLNPAQTVANGIVRRALVAGQGVLVEGLFTPTAYAEAERMADEDMLTVVDGIAHITREPIDARKQVITQTWSYIGGFAAPTDALTTPAVIPTATASAYKRAAIVESF